MTRFWLFLAAVLMLGPFVMTFFEMRQIIELTGPDNEVAVATGLESLFNHQIWIYMPFQFLGLVLLFWTTVRYVMKQRSKKNVDRLETR